MFITVITDCTSQNDIGRQETRLISLFDSPVSFVGVNSSLDLDATLETAGNLIDILDAAEEREGVVIVNVAPRGDKSDGKNGTSFCYFKYKNILVLSTIKGYTLSLIKKLKLVDSINLLDIEKVTDTTISNKLIDKVTGQRIIKSQFRSFDFAPRVAKWLKDGISLPSTPDLLSTISAVPNFIWFIDSFGNAKTTILTQDLRLKAKGKIKTTVGIFRYYDRLKDIPYGETAIYTGSSGLGNKRFLEIATQGREGSAAKTLTLKIGEEIKFL
ncbi:MAG: hypothetical protein UU76_C0010G0012 [Parcubacteria group bacterium GW2011_GWC1_41_7]|nr:MAG: hypothetical protein UU76_C0010G0012 [Parcubacteria group bacterium GW2011_GWC1_41_7]